MQHNGTTGMTMAVSLVFIMVTGCASYSEVKTMSVDHRWERSNIQAEVLSACVHEVMLEQELSWGVGTTRRNFDGVRKLWFIVQDQGSLVSNSTGNYNMSLSFSDSPSGGTVIELRSLKSIWGTTIADEEKINQALDMCISANSRS